MKKITLLLGAFFLGLSLNAQEIKTPQKNTLDVSYYSMGIGSNIAVEYNKNIKRSTFIIGIKCHLNHYIKDDGYAYFKHFYAMEPAEFIGATLGYEYHFKDINPYVSPYLLFNSQYAHMHTKYRNDPIKGVSSPSYQSETIIAGPFSALETTIGAGLSIKLTDKISLNQSAGIGIAAFFPDNYKTSYNNYFYSGLWDPMYQWRIGFSYKL